MIHVIGPIVLGLVSFMVMAHNDKVLLSRDDFVLLFNLVLVGGFFSVLWAAAWNGFLALFNRGLFCSSDSTRAQKPKEREQREASRLQRQTENAQTASAGSDHLKKAQETENSVGTAAWKHRRWREAYTQQTTTSVWRPCKRPPV